MVNDFQSRSSELKKMLKDKFQEIRVMLKIQEQKAEIILKKNLSFLEDEITKMQKVP